ncbi:MAG: antibiotic resistance protein MarC [Gemmatimonadetes bacterium]|nr:MAG: antibiotic resistance protein MarC [Gemmatimonadota bacterium]
MIPLLKELLLIFTSVLFIVDPFAAVPSFLAMTARDTPAQRRAMARRGAWTCAVTLTVFALGGSLIFTLFGITLGAFKIAGGVLIGLNALEMVQARRSMQRETPVEQAEGTQKEDVGIIPLGVPMLAGPGAISTVMVLALGSRSAASTAALYVSVALTAYVSYVVLAAATAVEHRLGQTGMRILTRLMGLVLCAIAVQFIVDGIKITGLAGSA